MNTRTLRLLGALLLLSLLIGCGGGNGGSGISREQVQFRAIATTRNARSTFAIAGLARTGVTRRPGQVRMGRRAAIFLTALRRTRSVTQGFDEGTQLHYTVTLASNASGRQDLFTDAAQTDRAGDIYWPAPQWTNNQAGAYPVVFKATYRLAKGEFAGDRGTLDIKLNDASGESGTIHVENTNEQGEQIVSDLEIVGPTFRAEGNITSPNGEEWKEEDWVRDDGVMVCRFDFPDGSYGEMTAIEDGTGTMTYYGSDGGSDAWGDYDSEGIYDVTYYDGYEEEVDVDDWGDDWGDTTWDDPFFDENLWDEWFEDWEDYWGDEWDDDSEDRSRKPASNIRRPPFISNKR